MNKDNQYDQFVSDEIVVSMTSKWVLSVAPVIVPTDKKHPYNLFEQKKTTIQLRLAPVGGERVVFNLTWPQFDTLKRAVNKAQENSTMEKIGKMAPFYWNMKEACGESENFLRIFGDPDVEGLCPVRKMVIERQPLRKDQKNGKFEPSKYPWYIEICSGRGKKLPNKTGGFYMQNGSYKEKYKCFANLTDGQMKELVFWGEYFMNVFESALKNAVVEGYSNILKQKNAMKNARNGNAV